MRLLSRSLFALLVALLAVPAAANASDFVTEYSDGLRPGSAPTGIVAGPDGAMWFTEQALPGGIGRISPSGEVTRFTDGLSADATPYRIAVGPDGNLWYTDNSHRARVGRITPDGVITEWGLGDGTVPSGITAGPDGNVWYVEAGKAGRITRITPDGARKTFTAGLTDNSAPTSITAGPDGNLWFTESVNPGRIGRITPAGVITEFPATGAGGPPQEITAGPDGNLWFTVGGSKKVGRITTAGNITFSEPLRADADPQGIVAGADGALYIALRGRPAVARITTAGAVTELDGLSSGATGVAAASDGALWVTESADPGRIARMTVPPEVFSLTSSGLPTLGPTGSAARPALGSKVVLRPVSGTVRVQLPGSSQRLVLDGTYAVPLGAVIDTRAGKLAMTSALDSRGATQTGTFWGGKFRVRQSRRERGMTEIALAGDRPSCQTTKAAAATTARKRRAVWGSDRNGRFRTRGSNSVATVRGTKWYVEDRCDGTYTKVTSGAVVVRDLVKRRNVVVKAGRSYLARPKPQKAAAPAVSAQPKAPKAAPAPAAR
jgi:streptogramin lyase